MHAKYAWGSTCMQNTHGAAHACKERMGQHMHANYTRGSTWGQHMHANYTWGQQMRAAHACKVHLGAAHEGSTCIQSMCAQCVSVHCDVHKSNTGSIASAP